MVYSLVDIFVLSCKQSVYLQQLLVSNRWKGDQTHVEGGSKYLWFLI